ncbi:MAG TPA: porin [Steroidobacteraceae bacterium]|jgi:phosphate-selective porin OprO/OprP
MRLRLGLAGFAAALVASGAALAQVAPSVDIAALLKRLDEAEQRIKVLERKLELQEEAQTTASASAPQVRASPSRFSIGTSDGANFVRLRGMLHVDGRHFEGDDTPATANTWLLRRVRPMVEGTFANIYDVRFTPDFAQGRTVLQDAYVTARFKPWAAVTVGKFKQQVGLERIQSANDTRFVERAFPTSIVPNRDIGVQLGGDFAGGAFNYSISYTNGVNDGGSSDSLPTPDVENDAKGDVSARVFFQPFLNSDKFALRGLGFGVGGTYVDVSGTAANPLLPSYRTPGQATFFSYRANTTFADGERLRYSPQFYYYYRSFGVLGEYAVVSQDVSRAVGASTLSDTLDNKAWQLQFSWLLTGEDEGFRNPTPGTNFEVGKPGRGAWELVARIHELKIDDDAFSGGANSFANPATAARRARAAAIGLNWYLNPNVRWSFNYEQTQFDGGAVSADRPDEKVYLTRIGLAF